METHIKLKTYADILLPLPLEGFFTYSIPDETPFLSEGMRVIVPFGKTKTYTGICVKIHHLSPLLYEAKEIIQVVDATPIATPEQIDLWKWIASYYLCTPGEVFRAAIPSIFILESETLLQNAHTDINENDLLDDEWLVWEALQLNHVLPLSEVVKIVNHKKVYGLVQRLIEKKIIHVYEDVKEKYKVKTQKYVNINPAFSSPEALAALLSETTSKGQRELLMLFFQERATKNGLVLLQEFSEKNNISKSRIQRLVDKGVLEITENEISRFELYHAHAKEIVFSDAQQSAYHSLSKQLEQKNICVLHGLTSSGKTQLYIKQIQTYIDNHQQVLFLVPEIALTTQLVSRLRTYFGSKVLVYHSKNSDAERAEVWLQVLRHASTEGQLIVGARSTVFLPFRNLSLIVVDEEHEQNYKQTDPSPRYHARDVATVLAKKFQAKVILGSATPSLETYYNTQNQKYGLVVLNERFGGSVLPEFELISLKDKAFRKQMKGHFSDTLIERIHETLSLNKQVILFQNRRGFAPVLECLSCGNVPQCPHCDVSLTVHKFKNELRCHYCGYSENIHQHCQVCHTSDLDTKGFGTEQIELEVASLFPQTSIARLDQDSTRGKKSYENIFESFQKGKTQILIGTQMLAKGLDFENVGLVGVLQADSMLYFPDFRAFERSFQLLTQVSGRAGRSNERGKVVIQTYNPTHPIIHQVIENDYTQMFKEQLEDRFQFQYPPYFKLIKIQVRHKNYNTTKEAASWLSSVIKQSVSIIVLGPEEPAISRIKNMYIRDILLKIPNTTSLSDVKNQLRRIRKSFETIGLYKSVKLSINVDVY